jgi:hypothetical protein
MGTNNTSFTMTSEFSRQSILCFDIYFFYSAIRLFDLLVQFF